MSQYKIAIFIVVIVGFLAFLTMIGRLVYLLVSRKTLDLAATEMKWYIGVSLLILLVSLTLIIITGEVPLKHSGTTTFASNPFMFLFITAKIGALAAVCAYAFVKVLRCRSWLVRIRK